MTTVRFAIAFLGSLLYLEAFFFLSFFFPLMAFKVPLQHGTSPHNSYGLIHPGDSIWNQDVFLKCMKQPLL